VCFRPAAIAAHLFTFTHRVKSLNTRGKDTSDRQVWAGCDWMSSNAI